MIRGHALGRYLCWCGPNTTGLEADAFLCVSLAVKAVGLILELRTCSMWAEMGRIVAVKFGLVLNIVILLILGS